MRLSFGIGRASQRTDGFPKLSNISLGDCQFIDDLMTRYSAFEHSQSNENPVEVPDEADLRKDLEALKKWRDDFKKQPVQGVVNAAAS